MSPQYQRRQRPPKILGTLRRFGEHYGFLVRDDGEEDVYVDRNAFDFTDTLPILGARYEFEVTRDAAGRPRASWPRPEGATAR